MLKIEDIDRQIVDWKYTVSEMNSLNIIKELSKKKRLVCVLIKNSVRNDIIAMSYGA